MLPRPEEIWWVAAQNDRESAAPTRSQAQKEGGEERIGVLNNEGSARSTWSIGPVLE